MVVWKGASSYYFHNVSLLLHNVFSNFTTLRSVALCSTNFHNSPVSLIIQSVPICFIHFHILSFIFMISNSIFQHFVHFHNISSIYKSIILENIDTWIISKFLVRENKRQSCNCNLGINIEQNNWASNLSFLDSFRL